MSISTTKEGIFDKLYAAAKEVYDLAKKPLIKNQIKRKLSGAYDDASNKIIEAQLAINKARESFDQYNVNTVLQNQMTITQCKLQQTAIKVEYLELFGTEMNTGEEDAS